MAQRVEVVLIDDLDGTQAVETVGFALDGSSYEIDLNDANAAALRNALGRFAEHGRRVSTSKTRGRAKRRRAAH